MAKKLTIPLLDLKREYAVLKKEIEKELGECFKTHHWILGEKVGKFEKETARYLGIRFAIGVASGTDALLLALRALAIKQKKKEFFANKHEIITTPLTFAATAEAIVRSGATPVFVDIDPDTFNIDPEKIKKAVTRNTVGIVPVHLYGLGCAMDKILSIAKKNGLFVLEDTAQAFGGTYKGKRLGALGCCGAYSFFPSKTLGGCGDGGLVTTNDVHLAELVKVLRDHGQKEKYNAKYIGYNSRLDSLQAAVLSVKLRYLDKFNNLRRKIACRYSEGLKDVTQIQTPYQPSGFPHIFHLYTIKVPAPMRDGLLEYLNSCGIQSRIYYPVPLYKMKAFRKAKIRGNLNNLKQVLSQILTLPLHPFLKAKETDYVIKALRSYPRLRKKA